MTLLFLVLEIKYCQWGNHSSHLKGIGDRIFWGHFLSDDGPGTQI